MMRETGVENGIIYGAEDRRRRARPARQAPRRSPTYLFLGTIDTHGPWIARKPWIDIYSPGPYHGPFQEFGTAKDLGFKPGSMGCSIIPPPADVERLRAIYDSAVSYHDQQVGRLVAQLKSWGIWDQTMLIITADHGEELFEDGRCGHGGSLRDSLVRVPLLIHDPARFPGGTIVEEGAEGVDLLPTMLAAVGAPAVDDAQGERARAARAGRRARLAAAVVRVDVRVRARDADRPLEGARRQDRRADRRATWSTIRARPRTSRRRGWSSAAC